MTEEQANLPWSEDLIETEDSYGKYYSRHVLDAKGRAVCDMQNSDVAEIHEDWDENGCVRTDLVAAQHAALIVKAVNGYAALRTALTSIADLLDKMDETPFGETPKLLDKMAEIASRALSED